MRFSNTRVSSSRSPATITGAAGWRDLDLDVAVLRQRLQSVHHLPDDRHKIDRRFGMHVLGELDAREREQIVDQPRHPGRLRLHDGEEARTRVRIVAR